MIIAVNTRLFISGSRGAAGFFSEEFFVQLARQHPEHQFYFLSDHAMGYRHSMPENVICKQLIFPLVTLLSVSASYNLSLPRVLRKIKADVYVSPDGCCFPSASVPQCLIVQELSFLPDMDKISGKRLWRSRYRMSCLLKKAQQIVTVSDFFKRELEMHYPYCSDKIAVVLNMPEALYKPLSREEKERVKEQYTEGVEYFFYRGAVHSGHQVVSLLRAFSVFKKRQKSNMKLVICPGTHKKNESLSRLLQTFKYRSDVVVTGELEVEEQALLTAAAYAMIYPSLRGVGGRFPLESLQCGVPVIADRSEVMTETGGDAFLYFETDNYEDLAGKMMLLYKDETLRSKLVANGLLRLQVVAEAGPDRHLWHSLLKAAGAE
jgi:glycosyltransferase involved in cell wall biosynthesis